MKKFCSDLLVVNDAAERAVKAVQEFSEMTMDDNHRDDIILVASDHRQRIPNINKTSLFKL